MTSYGSTAPYMCHRCGRVCTKLYNQTYTSDHTLLGRLITMENIEVDRCSCGDAPGIWRLGELLRALEENPGHDRWRWDEMSWAWKRA